MNQHGSKFAFILTDVLHWGPNGQHEMPVCPFLVQILGPLTKAHRKQWQPRPMMHHSLRECIWVPTNNHNHTYLWHLSSDAHAHDEKCSMHSMELI